MEIPEGIKDEERELWRRLDAQRLPRQIAITMDGNGRWAQQRHLPRIAGHRAGVEAVRAATETCARLGIPALTLYAFSTENWRRPEAEVSFLMGLLRSFLQSEVAELDQQNIRLGAIGRLQELPAAVRHDLEAARAATADNTGMRLTLALNYGARAELVDACRSLVQAAAAGQTPEITEESLGRHLYTADLPELDLLIRTSGEMRLSNFLLWQSAYAEIMVTPVLWPDFRARDMLEAIWTFQQRERRFGGLAGAAKQGAVQA